jgi:hypothetical protein
VVVEWTFQGVVVPPPNTYTIYPTAMDFSAGTYTTSGEIVGSGSLVLYVNGIIPPTCPLDPVSAGEVCLVLGFVDEDIPFDDWPVYFNAVGTYKVTVAYFSTDSTYANNSVGPPTITVNVVPVGSCPSCVGG